jgi:hypothetical protein
MQNPVETSDHLLSQYLGASLQTATIRLAAGLIGVSAILALFFKII